jgi:hypothetical protein
LLACREEPQRGVPPAATFVPLAPSAIAERLHLDAAAIELEADPASPAGDLEAEVARYTTLDACAEERVRTFDPLLRDAVRSIGYDTLARDSCRVLEALKSKRVEACSPIAAAALRRRCESLFAMATAAPELCPLESRMAWSTDARREERAVAGGHDATCVAVASRDLSLCKGTATFPERAICEAVLAKTRTSCTNLGGGDRQRCEHDSTRLAKYMTTLRTPAVAPDVPTFSLDLTPEGDVRPAPDPHVELGREVVHGLVVVSNKGVHYTELGTLLTDGGTAYAPSPLGRTRLALSVTVPPTGGAGKLERMELVIPGRATWVVPGAHCDCTVRALTWGTSRGAPVELEVTGVVGVGPAVFKMRAHIKTFVRDLVQLPITPLGSTATSDRGSKDAGR